MEWCAKIWDKYLKRLKFYYLGESGAGGYTPEACPVAWIVCFLIPEIYDQLANEDRSTVADIIRPLVAKLKENPVRAAPVPPAAAAVPVANAPLNAASERHRARPADGGVLKRRRLEMKQRQQQQRDAAPARSLEQQRRVALGMPPIERYQYYLQHIASAAEKADAGVFWFTHGAENPELYQLFLMYGAIPAGGHSVESAFSIAGGFSTDERPHLDPAQLDAEVSCALELEECEKLLKKHRWKLP